MKTQILSIVIVLSLALSSCGELFQNCIHGNGDVQVETREITAVTKVELSGSYELYYTKSDDVNLLIEAESNLFQYIKTRQNGDELEIYTTDNRCIDSSDPVKVYLKSPSLSIARLIGSGLLNCDSLTGSTAVAEIEGSGYIEAGLYGDYSKVIIEGSGRAEVYGEAASLKLHVVGSGHIKASNLIAYDADAHIEGSGSIYVYASHKLDAVVDGSGFIRYSGNPEIVNDQVNGSGSIRPI